MLSSPNSPLLTSRFRQALEFATRLHADQVRKGTDIPYIAHLLAVAALVLEHGADEDVAIAGLLHDAAEDQGGMAILQEIKRTFGRRVSALVEACSDTMETPKPPWKERKVRYINHLATAPEDVLLIALADKLHNARAVLTDFRKHGDGVWVRFQGGKEGTLWYYEEIASAFTDLGKHPYLTRELTVVVKELLALARG
jgi:GTP pyrophosphokinase